MNVLSFPKMFIGNSTSIVEGVEATSECLHLGLSSENGELSGDPEFGLRLKRFTFNQNNYVLRDILIDEIYTYVSTFHPEVFIERKDIKINQENHKLYATIPVRNKKDFKANTYSLVILEEEEEE